MGPDYTHEKAANNGPDNKTTAQQIVCIYRCIYAETFFVHSRARIWSKKPFQVRMWAIPVLEFGPISCTTFFHGVFCVISEESSVFVSKEGGAQQLAWQFQTGVASMGFNAHATH